MRERYNDLMSKPDYIEDILLEGASKARAEALPVIRQVREAIGLRAAKSVAVAAGAASQRKGRFVSFRDEGASGSA